ncbi:sulfatase-like hydrolase/transferase [Arcticibacterium luteifluviistationis]|uniref:Choline-sulfatase n=1 Tax=Arcticibacterium luteifluviistationis TaxID=1784714 RepID=A0A2Z4G6S3_9BACT|nr:sulfatase-like hydrolase/transferase [Arcticibacterium luteifluviistationis]AWV96773.1 choline-sulfatase [Arcticibacterium luteifluviistationis]
MQKIAIILCLLACFSCSKKEKDKPNIVFIFTDDQTFDAVNGLGNKQVITPNLDKLFQSGTTFSHAYNMGSWSGAVCTASRSMIISGMSVWNANKNRENWHQKDSASIAQTWPKLMESAGYDTYMTGKWHVDVPAESIFQKTVHVRPGMPDDAFKFANMGKVFKEQVATGKKTYAEVMPNGYNRPLSPTDNSWSPTDTSKGGYWEGGKHWSEVLKDDAKGFINEASTKDNPFFMYLAFNAPHDPRQAPQEFLDLYTVDDIEIPESFQPDYPLHDEIGVGPKLRDEALAPFPRTEFAIKTHLKEYYALISHLDHQIGEIVNELEEKGLMENTYIFLTADHGLAMGKHGLLGKQNMYDHSMRVPLLVAGPDLPKGQTNNEDVFLQDIMATSLELAQVEKPAFVEFNSLLSKVKNPEEASKLNGVYGAYLARQRMMRKDGYKLIVYPKADQTLLFDMTEDPLEMNNLSNDPAFQDKKQELLTSLISRQKELNDELDLSSFLNSNR